MEKHGNHVERSLEVVGYKWALLIVRELLDGPRRFTQISRALPNANQKMIIARLRELEAAGVVSRVTYAEVPPRVEYSLTPRGRALRPVVDALRSWGKNLPAPVAFAVRRGRRRTRERSPRSVGGIAGAGQKT